MSREIDLTKSLSAKDKQYLMVRGREQEVFENERLYGDDEGSQTPVHTGDVSPTPETQNPAGMRDTTRRVGMDLAASAAAAGMPGVVRDESGAPAGETADEVGLQPPYTQKGVTKEMLVAEIERRNALPENAEYEDISTEGNKGELAARLVEDDEATAEIQSELNSDPGNKQ